jgi:large subunit ribosomal protein L25
MENFFVIKAEQRDEVGKKIAKKLRREGKIPAIIYGGNKESVSLSLSTADITALLKTVGGANSLLKIDWKKNSDDAMLHELQYDYLSNHVIHADFLRVDITKPVTVQIPVELKGESIGVRMEDGVMDFITREIKITCLPDKIPTKIIVDVTDLHVGKSIKVENLNLDKEIKLLSDPQTVICVIPAKGGSSDEPVAETPVPAAE